MGKKKLNKDRIVWRSHEVSRIEAFSDAVFAFAITLLIVSLEVPKDLEELLENMRGFVPFAICFTLLFQIWYTQNIYFRRYGLSDIYTVSLNGILMFFVLFFVYPLKFLFTHITRNSEPGQIGHLFYIYSGGFAIIYLLFALMYFNAYRCREDLELTESEVFETRTGIFSKLIMALVGVLSVFLAFLGGVFITFAWMVYIAIGPVLGVYYGRREKKYKARFGVKTTKPQPKTVAGG